MINRFYIPGKVKRLLSAFVSLLTLTLILLTSLPSQGLIPDAAYIVKFQGSRLTLGAGTSRNRQPVQLQDRLESNRILYVPGDNQHWANLAFIANGPKDSTGLIVRAGPHRTASQWSFPCTARGGFTIAWQRGGDRGCESGIRVQPSGVATSQLLTQKALTAQGRNEVVVVPTPNKNLLQTSDNATGVLVDVVVGEVRVQSDRYPQGRPIRAGQRYAYPQDTVTPIDSNAILNSPGMRDFLNPNNWSSPNLPDRAASSVTAQLGELQVQSLNQPNNWSLEFPRYTVNNDICDSGRPETTRLALSGSSFTGQIPWVSNNQQGYASINGVVSGENIRLTITPPSFSVDRVLTILNGSRNEQGGFVGSSRVVDGPCAGRTSSFTLYPEGY